MRPGDTHPNKLKVFGSSMLNKLKGQTRRNRKRVADKKRRELLKKEMENEV